MDTAHLGSRAEAGVPSDGDRRLYIRSNQLAEAGYVLFNRLLL